jgi:hypothetical protein
MIFWPILALLSICVITVSAQSVVPGFDAARVTLSQTGNMDMGGGDGDLDITRFELRSFLCRPISPIDGLFILPLAEYRMTSLDFDGTPAAYPIGDEDLHSLSLSSFAISMREGSPWIYGGWARAELASDFQQIDGDDFTFDFAAGAGYRFDEKFTLGFGAAVINLNGDEKIYPGIGFDWLATDQLRMGLYGPTFVTAYSLDEDWLFTFRGDPGGGLWNVTDDAGASRSIKLRSYRLGLYASRRLAGQLWLTAGGGVAIWNEIDYTTPHGSEITSNDPDEGFFGLISLRLKTW